MRLGSPGMMRRRMLSTSSPAPSPGITTPLQTKTPFVTRTSKAQHRGRIAAYAVEEDGFIASGLGEGAAEGEGEGKSVGGREGGRDGNGD